jgi:hypothetical protein
MNESTSALTLTPEQRWARWQDQGARHDARVGRNMRLIGALALTMAAIWTVLVL